MNSLVCPIERIQNHSLYKAYMRKNKDAEKDRFFCRHNEAHAYDVARIAYIIALEEGLNLKKEVIYAAAFLHDIGRFKQYETGLCHAQASAILAKEILEDCPFTLEEKEDILLAIKNHRQKNEKKHDLSDLLYLADKASRLCSCCSMVEQCKKLKKQTPLSQLY